MGKHNGIFFTSCVDQIDKLQPELVFVHGYTCDHTDWHSQLSALRTRHHIVTLDLNGHGASDQSAPTIDALAAGVVSVIEFLDLKKPIVVGHSMGTRVILEASQRCPASGLVLVDGSRAANSATQLARIDHIRQTNHFADYAASLFSQMFTDKTPPEKRAAIIARAQAMDAEWALALHSDVARYDALKLADALTGVRVPMLVVQATTRSDDGRRGSLKTGTTSTPYTDFVKSFFSDKTSRVCTIPDVGHFPQFEASNALATEIDLFAVDIQNNKKSP